MFLSSPLLALLLTAPAGIEGTQAQPSAGPTVGKADFDERTTRAAWFYESNRNVEAALEFESLWRDYPGKPANLYNAAVSRAAAGHNAHAVAYLREYLARTELEPPDRAQGQELLAESLAKVTPVTVTVTVALPSSGPRADTLVVRHVARGFADLRPDLRIPVKAGTQPLELDPGTWVVRAEGPGNIAAERQIQVSATPTNLVLSPTLSPVDPVAVPPEVIRKTTLGLTISGATTAVVGLGLVTGGAAIVQGANKNCDTGKIGDCRHNFSRGLLVRDFGVSVIGVGAGAALSSLVWRSTDPRRRRNTWIALTAIGGVSTIVGNILAVRARIPFIRGNISADGSLDTWREHWKDHHHQVGSSFALTLAGLGIGLVTGSVTGLAVQRKHLGPRALRVAASAGASHGVLLLSGEF